MFDKDVACSGGSSRNNPHTGLHACQTQDAITHTFQHADRYDTTIRGHITCPGKDGYQSKLDPISFREMRKQRYFKNFVNYT